MIDIQCEKHGHQRGILIGNPRDCNVVCPKCYTESMGNGASDVPTIEDDAYEQLGKEEAPLPGMIECPVCGIGRITEDHGKILKKLEGQAQLMQARQIRLQED